MSYSVPLYVDPPPWTRRPSLGRAHDRSGGRLPRGAGAAPVVVASKIDTEGALLGNIIMLALQRGSIAVENRLGRILDYGVIVARVEALYASSARVLDEPRLLSLIQDGAPTYAWPADQRHVWEPRSPRRVIQFLTRPRHRDVSLVPA